MLDQERVNKWEKIVTSARISFIKEELILKHLRKDMLEKMSCSSALITCTGFRMLAKNCFSDKFIDLLDKCISCTKIVKFYNHALDTICKFTDVSILPGGIEECKKEYCSMDPNDFVNRICKLCRNFATCSNNGQSPGCYDMYIADYNRFISKVMFTTVTRKCDSCDNLSCGLTNMDVEKCFMEGKFIKRAAKRRTRERVEDTEPTEIHEDIFGDPTKVGTIIASGLEEDKFYRIVKVGKDLFKVFTNLERIEHRETKYVKKPKKIYYLDSDMIGEVDEDN